MSRILLADASPHAQRLGEGILRGEGHEVVTVTDGETALRRMADVDPDLVLADVALPQGSGLDLCRFLKSQPRHRFTKIVLTAGAMAVVDEEAARRAGIDALIRKPFEASVLMETLRPLLEFVRRERAAAEPATGSTVDRERVRAAVTLALDAAMPAMINELTDRVMAALDQ